MYRRSSKPLLLFLLRFREGKADSKADNKAVNYINIQKMKFFKKLQISPTRFEVEDTFHH